MTSSMVWLLNKVAALGGTEIKTDIQDPRLCPLGQSRPRSRGGAPENACGVNKSGNNTEKRRADGGVAAWAGTTPVLGGLRRPKPTAGAAASSGVVPAHAAISSRGNYRKESREK